MAEIRAQALVMESVAGIARYEGGQDGGTSYSNAAGIMPWKARTRMLVPLPGQAPVQIWPTVRMSRKKYTVAGTALPVTLDPAQPRSARVAWDEVPDLDDWIRAGAEVFSDPDAARARISEAQRAFAGVPLADVDAGADLVAGEPTARVLAASPGQVRFEVLLSVAVPGRPRFGARWHGRIPLGKHIPEWGEIPVRVGAGDKVEILWDRLGSILEHATKRADATGAQLEAMLAASTGPAWTPGVPLGRQPAAAADPTVQLQKLADLHAAGVLTDEELAAERARVIAQI
jgi:hypothetical protein